ncbi:MAG: hypothetical protein LQ337_000206 [Flavoplaca oasis]|nr:MAG: hypothetical protein LQ337_000206 [Flavoplaca oasis]
MASQRAVDLPISGGGHVSFHLEDTAFIIVTHSYKGTVGSNAISGLEAAHRKAEGEKGGIVHLVFISAYAAPLGSSLVNMNTELAPFVVPNPTNDSRVIDTGAEKVFYNDVHKSVSAPSLAKLSPQATASFTSKMTETVQGTEVIPCTYIFCEKDPAVPPSL